MKKVLFALALFGWLASFIVHILSIGGYDVSKEFPFVMALHVGIFAVWIPTIWHLKKDEEYKQFQQSGFWSRSNPINFFKVLFKNAPPFLKIIAIAGFVYAPLNFLLFSNEVPGEASTDRMFSGHWMAFYGISLAVLYPFNRSIVL